MSVLPYNPSSRPALVRGERKPGALAPSVGMSCPVCQLDLLYVELPDLKELPDGSATAQCPNCHTPLRQNAKGFVFAEAK